jgi:hypothetical protein
MKAKLFYKWFDSYFNAIHCQFQVYQENLKRRVLTILSLHRRRTLLKFNKAIKFNAQSLKIKYFYALLKNITLERD